MENKPRKLSGTFFNCISIDRNYNNQQSILPHMHDDRLELFYVCSGQGQYMVDNRYYPIGEGDIVICNQGVLHGEEPDQVRQIRSYSIAITDVNAEGLPPNCLIAEGEYPVVVRTACQAGRRDHAPAVSAQRRCGKPACRVLQSGRGNAESDRFPAPQSYPPAGAAA